MRFWDKCWMYVMWFFLNTYIPVIVLMIIFLLVSIISEKLLILLDKTK